MKITFEGDVYVVSGRFKGRAYLTYSPVRSEAMRYACELMSETL